MTDWPAAHLKALKKHLDAGLSATLATAALNYELKTNYSRNAIIGKAQRSGLALRGSRWPAPSEKPPLSLPSPTPIVGKHPKRPDTRRAAIENAIRKIEPPRVVEVNPQNLPLLELAPNGCRWPSDAPPFVFCNCPQVAGLPYCEPHSRLAYRAPEPRRSHAA